MILDQRLRRFGRDTIDHPIIAVAKLLDEMADQQRNVFFALAQGRNADGEDIEAVIQIGSKCLLADKSAVAPSFNS